MSSYKWLRQRKMDELDAKIEDGELTYEEAGEELEDWEAGYGDYLYDQWKDEQLFKEFDDVAS